MNRVLTCPTTSNTKIDLVYATENLDKALAHFILMYSISQVIMNTGDRSAMF